MLRHCTRVVTRVFRLLRFALKHSSPFSADLKISREPQNRIMSCVDNTKWKRQIQDIFDNSCILWFWIELQQKTVFTIVYYSVLFSPFFSEAGATFSNTGNKQIRKVLAELIFYRWHLHLNRNAWRGGLVYDLSGLHASKSNYKRISSIKHFHFSQSRHMVSLVFSNWFYPADLE